MSRENTEGSGKLLLLSERQEMLPANGRGHDRGFWFTDGNSAFQGEIGLDERNDSRLTGTQVSLHSYARAGMARGQETENTTRKCCDEERKTSSVEQIDSVLHQTRRMLIALYKYLT